MTIRKLTHESNAGATGANHRSTTYYEGEIHDKHFTVLIDSTAAPTWGGEELDEDERADVLTEIEAAADRTLAKWLAPYPAPINLNNLQEEDDIDYADDPEVIDLEQGL